METEIKYDWYKQANGNYTILNVPIFGCFKEKITVRDKVIEREVTPKDLDEICKKMAEEKKRGWYSRIMLSHHGNNSMDNIGVGYADNFWNDGENIFVDMSEITPITFKEIYHKNRYPGRSIEYKREEQLVESIALLDTRLPHFRYPIMSLSREPIETDSFVEASEVHRFYSIKNEVIMTVLKENKKTLEEVIAEAVKKFTASNLTQFQTVGAEGSIETARPNPDDKKDDGMDERIGNAVKKYMDANFSSMIDKYMETKKTCEPGVADSTSKMSAIPTSIPFTDKNSSYDPGSAGARFASVDVMNKENKFLAGYEREDETIKEVAFMAAKDWEDTVGQRDRAAGKKFYEDNPKKEKFVEDAVSQEKAAAGSYFKIYRGGS